MSSIVLFVETPKARVCSVVRALALVTIFDNIGKLFPMVSSFLLLVLLSFVQFSNQK